MSEPKVKDENELYKTVSVCKPSLKELADISAEMGLQCTDEELAAYKNHMDGMCSTYDRIDELVAPTLPVNYPRTPGYRPAPEDNKCNAWFWRCDIAGASDGILKGKTVGIKDNICVAGVPMNNGTRLMEGYVPDIDATVVTKILDAGGRIVGKTNNEHLCFSGSSWTNDSGPILNPVDQTRSAGGSSGGSATALVNGDIDLALGGDQGGSVRIPSSWCGVVGIKPTWGLVPYTGAVPIAVTCDHLGPMARNVKDCALLLEAIAGYDEGRDPRQPRDLKVPTYSKMLSGDLSGKKIGLVTEGFDFCEEDVQTIVRQAANRLTKAGAVVEEVSIPIHKDGVTIWAPICTDGAYKCMVEGTGAGYHYKGYYPSSLMGKMRDGYATKGRNMSDVMKVVCLFGKYIDKNYGNKFYGKAQNLNMHLTAEYDKVLAKYDVIVMPTLPYKAPLLPLKDSKIEARMQNALGMVCNTAPFDNTGHPSLSINAGTSEGLPIGMMITGKHFDDATVLQVAYAFEKIRDGN